MEHSAEAAVMYKDKDTLHSARCRASVPKGPGSSKFL